MKRLLSPILCSAMMASCQSTNNVTRPIAHASMDAALKIVETMEKPDNFIAYHEPPIPFPIRIPVRCVTIPINLGGFAVAMPFLIVGVMTGGME